MDIYIYIYYIRRRRGKLFVCLVIPEAKSSSRSSRCPLVAERTTKNHSSCSPPMYYNYYDCYYFNLLQLSLSPRARPDVIILYHCCRLQQQYSSLVGNCRLYYIRIVYTHIIYCIIICNIVVIIIIMCLTRIK